MTASPSLLSAKHLSTFRPLSSVETASPWPQTCEAYEVIPKVGKRGPAEHFLRRKEITMPLR